MPDEDVTTDGQRLTALLRGRHPCVRITTHEEEEARRLVEGVAYSMDRRVWMWNNVDGIWEPIFEDADAVPDTEHPAAALVYMGQYASEDLLLITFDLAGHLKDEGTLRALRSLIHKFRDVGGTLVMIDHSDELPEIARSESTPLTISLPDDAQLESMIRRTLRRIHRESPLDVRVTKRDLRTFARNLQGLPRRQAEQIIVDAVAIDQKFDPEDMNTILARKRQIIHQGGILDYVEAPIDLSDIGGLRRLKSWLRKRANAFSDEAAAFGLNAPRGILLLGVQGAGKSLCAKAIATAWARPLLRLDPSALYDRYVGESEQRLRKTLRQAESMAPIVLWIDEIEKGFASAASRSSDGGLSKRMFGTLLTWMQEHVAPVFLVATANDIEALPPELLRKGRFDEIFFVDLPKKDVRRKIAEIHLRKRGRDAGDFDLTAIAEASDGYSGAEIEQAVIASLHEAFDAGEKLVTERVVESLINSPPLSVTMAERIADLRAWAKGRCVPAD